MHKNKYNNKVYIGITGRKPEIRWANGSGYWSNKHFHNAIKKYGWNEGFEHIILYSNLTKKNAEFLERKLIKEYDAINQDKGYNLALGGSCGNFHTDETKRKLSEIQHKPLYAYDRTDGHFIRRFESTIQAEAILGVANAHISAVCLKKMKTAHNYVFRYENDGVEFGKPLSEDDLIWVNSNDCYVSIIQYDKNGKFIAEFNSIVEAKKATGCTSSMIEGSLSGKNKLGNGFIWKRSSDINPNDKYQLPILEVQSCIPNIPNEKECYQYDQNGKFIASYESTTKAALSIGKPQLQSCIASCCRKEVKTSNNSYWRYAKDYEYGKDLPSIEIDFPNLTGSPKNVYQYDICGNFINSYPSITEAAKNINGSTSAISKVCKKELKMHKGFIWRYEQCIFTNEELVELTTNAKNRKVSQYDMDDRYIATFKSIAEASKITNTNPSNIVSCCNGNYKYANNYRWKYA
jgi:hypothetical protein